jgi:hypothetical protein
VSKNAMPKSKATNAYDLLTDVIDLIVEEPLRYNQGNWRQTEEDDYFSTGFPKCGTVCCVGGWVDLLKSKTPTENVEVFTVASGVGASARQILGLSAPQARELFTPDCVGESSPQTDEHARLGVLHIRKFQKKHAKQLKAKRV